MIAWGNWKNGWRKGHLGLFLLINKNIHAGMGIDDLDDFPMSISGKRWKRPEEREEREEREDGHELPSKVCFEEYLSDEDDEDDGVESFVCGIDGCEETFTSEIVYNAHYKANHMHVCSVCRNTFYTFHLLNLHVLEYHDSLFKKLNEKRPMYECLIRSCEQRFSSSDERVQHLIQYHQIPTNSSLLTAVEGMKGKEMDYPYEDVRCLYYSKYDE